VHLVMRKLGDPSGFDEVWNKAVADAYERLNTDWAPAVPPSPESWPGWSLARVRLRKAWARSGNRSARQSPASKSTPPASLPWRERRLEHPRLPIAGIPDLVERIDKQLWVIDIKTGLNQADPSPEQRLQLLIYCGLVHATLGEMPTYAAVETTRGDRFSFVVDRDEVEDSLGSAVEAVNLFNSAAENGFTETLASPAPDACKWCPYRTACRPFLLSCKKDWEISHTVLFRVTSAAVHDHRSVVEGVVTLPNWHVNQTFVSVGFPFEELPSVGETWAATDYVGGVPSAVASWNTITFRWPSS